MDPLWHRSASRAYDSTYDNKEAVMSLTMLALLMLGASSKVAAARPLFLPPETPLSSLSTLNKDKVYFDGNLSLPGGDPVVAYRGGATVPAQNEDAYSDTCTVVRPTLRTEGGIMLSASRIDAHSQLNVGAAAGWVQKNNSVKTAAVRFHQDRLIITCWGTVDAEPTLADMIRNLGVNILVHRE
jgi:hypothetical protein